MAININPNPLYPGAYFDMARAPAAAAAAGYGRGLENELLLETTGRDVAARNLLAQYLSAPPEQQPAAFNQLLAVSPELANQVMTVEKTQNELLRAQQKEQAAREYAAAQHVLTSESPALALSLIDEDGSFRQQLHEAGLINLEDGISDEEALAIAEWAASITAPIAGVSEDRLDRKLRTVEAYTGRKLTDEEVLKIAGGGGTTINIGEKLQEPIPIAQLDKVRLPDGSPVPIGTTFAQAREMGAEVYSSEEQKRGQQQAAALAILDEIEQLALGPEGIFRDIEPGFVNRAGAALVHGISMLTQDDPTAALYEDKVKSSLAPIVRLFGETGALADADVNRALGGFPRTFPLPDTKEVAERKLRGVREIVTLGLRNYNKILAGEMEPIRNEPPAAAPTSVADLSDEELMRRLQQMGGLPE